MIEVRNGSDHSKAQFVYGAQYVDEPIALIDDPGVSESWYLYHQDANFNVTLLTDSAGNEVEHYQYSPYGQLTTFDADYRPLVESAAGNPFTYTGRFHDVETGLYYYRARHHHPGLGRFLQRDPLGLAPQGARLGPNHEWRLPRPTVRPWKQHRDGHNTYEFTRSSPIAQLDPLRTTTCDLGEIKPVPGFRNGRFSCPINKPTSWFEKFLCNCVGINAYCKGFWCKSCWAVASQRVLINIGQSETLHATRPVLRDLLAAAWPHVVLFLRLRIEVCMRVTASFIVFLPLMVGCSRNQAQNARKAIPVSDASRVVLYSAQKGIVLAEISSKGEVDRIVQRLANAAQDRRPWTWNRRNELLKMSIHYSDSAERRVVFFVDGRFKVVGGQVNRAYALDVKPIVKRLLHAHGSVLFEELAVGKSQVSLYHGPTAGGEGNTGLFLLVENEGDLDAVALLVVAPLEIELRGSETGNRIWLVDAEKGELLAWHDFDTRTIGSGASASPDWARPSTGVVIEAVEVPPMK